MGFQVLLVGRVGPSALSLHLNRTEEEIQEKGFGISEQAPCRCICVGLCSPQEAHERRGQPCCQGSHCD